MISNSQKMKDLNRLSQNIFTMIEENSGFWWSEIPKNEGFEPPYLRISSPWLKKILDFDDLMGPRMKNLNHLFQNIFIMVKENFEFWWSEIPKNEGFEPLISAYLHHGWRKFWILMIWNAQEWRIWTTYLRIFLLWLKKNLNFDQLEFPRIKYLKHLL